MEFDLREAHERAALMQPVIDEVFEDKLDAMLGHPKFDPHGQPIPSKNATWPKVADAPLLDVPAGTAGRVSRVTSEDADAITYLGKLGIVPGAELTLESVAPFDGPLAVRVVGKVHHLGRRLASAIHLVAREDAPRQSPGKERHPRRRHG